MAQETTQGTAGDLGQGWHRRGDLIAGGRALVSLSLEVPDPFLRERHHQISLVSVTMPALPFGLGLPVSPVVLRPEPADNLRLRGDLGDQGPESLVPDDLQSGPSRGDHRSRLGRCVVESSRAPSGGMVIDRTGRGTAPARPRTLRGRDARWGEHATQGS